MTVTAGNSPTKRSKPQCTESKEYMKQSEKLLYSVPSHVNGESPNVPMLLTPIHPPKVRYVYSKCHRFANVFYKEPIKEDEATHVKKPTTETGCRVTSSISNSKHCDVIEKGSHGEEK